MRAGGITPDEARTTRPTLARLVGDPDDFAARVWGREALLRSAATASAAGFADLLDLDDIDELVSVRGLRTPFVRLVKDGRAIPEGSYLGGGGIGAAVGDQAHDDGVFEQMAAGATLVLQGLHRIWPPLLEFGQDLAADLGHPTQINAYVTPAQSQGFGAHYDVHDVFVLQLSGEKRWFVHDPVFPVPLGSQPGDAHAEAIAARALGTPAIDTVLRPGDVLYLPRGYLHSAQALGEVSAHLTVGVPVWTRYAVLQRLLDELLAVGADEEFLREALPVGVDVGDPVNMADDLARVRESAGRALASAADEAVLARLDASARRSQRPAPIAPLAQIRATARPTPGDRFRVRGALRPALSTRDDGATVLTGRFPSVVLPPSERAALEAVLTAGECTLPDDPNAPLSRLLRRLVATGVVVPA